MEVILKPDFDLKKGKKIDLENRKVTVKKNKEKIIFESEFGLDLEINENAIIIISKATDFIEEIFEAEKATIYIISKNKELIIELSNSIKQELS